MSSNPLPPMSPMTPAPGMPGGPPGSGRFRQVDPLRLLRQHLVLLVVAGVVGIVVGVAAFLVLRRTSPEFASTAQLRVMGQITEAYDTIGGESNMTREEQLERFMANEIASITSEEMLRQAIARPATQRTQWYQSFNGNTRAAREALQEGQLRVSPVRGTSLIQLQMRATNEEDPQVILEDILSVYLDRLQLQTNQQIQGLRNTFRQQRDRARAEVARYEQQIARYSRDEGLTAGIGSQHESVIEFQQYAELVTALSLELDGARSALAALEEQIESNNFEPGADEEREIEQMPSVYERDQQVRRAEEALAAAELRYGENHPESRRIRGRLDTLRQLREQSFRDASRMYLQAQLEATSKSVSSLESQLAAAQAKLREAKSRKLDLSERMARLEQLRGALEAAKETETRAVTQLEEYNVLETRPDAVPVVRQVAPTEPELVSPKITTLVPLSTLLILGAVGGLVFLRELLDQRLKSPGDVKAMTSGELLGSLPDTGDDPSRHTKPERCVLERPTGLMAESFRQVRTAILSKMDRRGYRTLVFVGGQPGSGTTAVVHNVGSSLALNGRKVLLIDANFRRPGLHRVFGHDGEVGLQQVLQGKAEVDDVLQSCGESSLRLLPAGRVSQSMPELLEGAAFRSLLSKLETEYDAVLIDAPPALISSEAQLLAKQVDAVAVVARASRDKRGMVDRMLRELDGHRADVVGVVLNGVRASAGGYYRRAYEAFYSYRDPEAVEADASGPHAGNGSSGPARGGRRLDPDAATEAIGETSETHGKS